MRNGLPYYCTLGAHHTACRTTDCEWTVVVIVTLEACLAQIPHSLSGNTYWPQAIALIYFPFLKTLCLKIANKVMCTQNHWQSKWRQL